MAENKKPMNSETENKDSEKSKTVGGNAFLRLPYGLAKDKGLSTDGMAPREVWVTTTYAMPDGTTETKRTKDIWD